METNTDLEDFFDKLLSAGIITCDICSNLLSTPVQWLNKGEVACEACCTTNNLKGIPNPRIETILQLITLRCKFHGTGCPDRLPYIALKHHETNCLFQEKPCWLAPNCTWQGVQSSHAIHFTKCHPEHILHGQADIFSFTLDLTQSSSTIKLLNSRQDYFVQIKINNEYQTLHHTIFNAKETDEKYESIIKYIGQNSNSVQIKCNIKPEATKMELGPLKQVTGAIDSLLVEVKICEDDSSIDLDQKILHFFECPVCLTLMKPPIYQCKFGHSICSACKSRMDKCPNCRAVFGTARNYSLEGLTSVINYKCMYHHLGCEESFLAADSDKHEPVCAFKPYHCPLEGCSFSGSHSNITKHVEEKHRDQVVSGDFYRTTVEFRLEQMMDFYNFQQKIYMAFEENIFRLSFKRNSDYSFWAVEVMKKKQQDLVFTYEIGIIDMRKPDRKLIRCDVCFSEGNTEDLFKKCILFPNNILASYACNSLFTYYCQIRQRQ